MLSLVAFRIVTRLFPVAPLLAIFFQDDETTQAAPSEVVTGVLPGWAELGIAGLLFSAFVSKLIVAGWQYNDLRTELRESRASESRLVQQVLDGQRETLPALQASTAAITQQSLAIDRLSMEVHAMREAKERGGNLH